MEYVEKEEEEKKTKNNHTNNFILDPFSFLISYGGCVARLLLIIIITTTVLHSCSLSRCTEHMMRKPRLAHIMRLSPGGGGGKLVDVASVSPPVNVVVEQLNIPPIFLRVVWSYSTDVSRESVYICVVDFPGMNDRWPESH